MGALDIQNSIKLYKSTMTEEGATSNTLKMYLNTITKYIKFSNLQTVADISPSNIILYRQHIRERGVGGSSINSYLAALRSFFKFLHEHEYLDRDYSTKNFCRGLKSAKANKIRGVRQSESIHEETGRKLSKKERADMIEVALFDKTNSSNGLVSTDGERNALMLRIGFACGLRISDLVKLQVRDFSYDDEDEIMEWRLTYIAKKTGREVSFYVCEDALMKDLQEYVHKNKLSPDNYLFPTGRSKKMSERAGQDMYAKIANKCGINTSTHDMRRTCATHLYECGVSIYDISQQLGHASLEMTQKYLRIKPSRENLNAKRKAMNKMQFV